LGATRSTEHQQLADFLVKGNHLADAMIHVRKATQVREPLLSDPTDTRARRFQAIGYTIVCETQRNQGDCGDAIVS
jgi:hypothetical protein